MRYDRDGDLGTAAHDVARQGHVALARLMQTGKLYFDSVRIFDRYAPAKWSYSAVLCLPIDVIDEWQQDYLPLALGAIQRSAHRDNMPPVSLLVAPLPEADGWRERLKSLDDWGSDDLPNWRAIDQRLEELKGAFRRAVTPEDFKDVGRHARDLMKAAAQKAYRPEMLPAGREEPKDEATKVQFDLILDARLSGSHNREMRDVLRKSWDLANKVTHSDEGVEVDAFASAQATILVVRTLAKLDEELNR